MNKLIKIVLVCSICFVSVKIGEGDVLDPLNPFSLSNDTENIFQLKKKVISIEKTQPVEKPTIPEEPTIVEEQILTPQQLKITKPKLVKSKVKPTKTKIHPPKREVVTPPKSEIPILQTTTPTQTMPLSKQLPVSVEEKPELPREKLVNLVLWGIFSLVSIILTGLYLQRRYRSAQRGLFDETVLYQQPHLRDELRQLRIGYRGLEHMVKELEEAIEPLRQLGSLSIRELTRQLIEENTMQISNSINELKDSYKNLNNEIHKIGERLAVLDEIRGKNLKDVIHEEVNQYTKGWDKSLRDELMHHINTDKQLFAKLSERIDRRIDDIHKQTLQLTKEIKEIISRLDEIEVVASSNNTFGLPKKRPKQGLKIEETEMDKLHAQIYKLSDEGLSTEDIAQRVNLGKSEVRLILDLRKPQE